VEAGLMEVALSETNINEQIDYVYTFFKPEAEKKGLQMLASKPLPNKQAIIKTDKEKVYSVLTNLVKNALKYCDNGKVEVGYNGKDEYIEFFVKDTGIGISDEWKEKIFDRFTQTDVASKRASQGAGLGLAISKAYVEMLGGKIRVESTPGSGSVFFFTVPHHRAEIHNAESELKGTDSKKSAQIRDINVLIVEDDPTSAIFLDVVVKTFAGKIYKSKTGIETIRTLIDHPEIDLILMDIQMPEMDGMEATQKIREFNKDVIIIAQTAYGFAADREKVIKAGCNDYISKPIKKDLLIEIIEKYFHKT
jgi:CheY-like chemotaxis protein/anti-sigma regulatory factor (Ser/Thr protein kinase)